VRTSRPIRVTGTAVVPDPERLARFREAPERGPRPVFFSGGSGLRGAGRRLIDYTHNSAHVITPFDSGGSSAVLRAAFDMPAVGDLRNRMMALADRSALGHPETYALFAHRLPHDEEPDVLRAMLRRMVGGEDDRVRAVPEPLCSMVREHLGFFRDRMPDGFDLRGANVGNLVLAGAYLHAGRRLDPALLLFKRLVEVRGVVRPVVEESLHLAAQLASGRTVVGQHRLTGSASSSLDDPVERLFLSRSPERPVPYRPRIPDAVASLVRRADLLCYPIGSFHTSVIATLLPLGVADAIAEVDAPKVYVPNPGPDPEEKGLTPADRVRTLIRYLREGSEGRPPVDALLHLVLVDMETMGLSATHVGEIEKLGVRVLDTRLVSRESAPFLDDGLFVEALLSLT
jgi:CofD-related protein of GAK system